MRYSPSALFLTVAFGFLSGARGESLPHSTARELVVQAHTVVRAEAMDPLAAKRFRVLEVLRGDGLRVGDTLAYDDLGLHDLQIHEEGLPPGQKPAPRRVVQALLFLEAPAGKGAPQPVLSGLRFWTDDGAILVPEQRRNPGPYVLTVRREMDWDALVRRAREDCGAYSRLLAGKDLARPGRRCRALLEWVERHRAEFGSLSDGWGNLEQDVFQWVLAAGDVEDCWAAVQLYGELNLGAVPPLPTPAFARPGGRELLLGLALSEDQLEGDRVRALAILADPRTLWSEKPEVSCHLLTEREQNELIDRLIPLLKAKSAAIRAAAARALYAASPPPARPTQRALAALTAAYRTEAPGPARDWIATATCAIGGVAHWQELTGNPRGLFVRLLDFGHQGGKVFFWIRLDGAGLSVHECPTLTLERLDGARVVEKKTEPLPVTNLPRSWDDGWNGTPYLLAEFPTGGLSPGTWRVTVRGTAGKDRDKVKWTAEPRTFAVKVPVPGAAPEVISSDW